MHYKAMRKTLLIIFGTLYASLNHAHTDFKLGVENISPAFIKWLGIRRVGLITNQTGCDQLGRPTVDILRSHGINVTTLLAPEHGISGDVAASDEIYDFVDPKTGIATVSLYAKGTGKSLSAHMLKDIDVLIFDIQDSGMRHYTYIATLFYVVEAAAQHEKPLIVLDRPNPLGRIAEGPLVDPALKSFIAVAPIPLRHGMTVGELARYFNTARLDKKALIGVIPMLSYSGDAVSAQKCPMNLSPNIQTLASCYGYSFLGLLGEVRPFDVGIGTSMAFQCIMLPHDLKIPPNTWSALRSALDMQGITSSPYTYYSTRKKKQMVGLCIEIKDISKVSTCHALSAVIDVARKAGIVLSFAQAFDTAVGSKSVRDCFEGATSWSELMRITGVKTQEFFKKSRSACVYEPLPHAAITPATSHSITFMSPLGLSTKSSAAVG